MNAKQCLVLLGIAAASFAQSDQKFQIYGFADMTLTKYFPDENSSVRSVDKMDERLQVAFDHLNLYQDFRPNDRVRMLTELSFQGKPVYQKSRNGMRMKMSMPPFLNSDSVWTTPLPDDSNQTMKGIVKYDWGSFSLERAIFSVNLNRYCNLSFGKFITPAGIWNVDHGSPVIMTVNQPSQYTFRELYPKSQLGIMENGTVFIGDADLAYSLYVSSGRNDPVINSVSDMAVGGQLRLGLPVLDELSIGLTGYTGAQTTVYRTLVINTTGTPAPTAENPYNAEWTSVYTIEDNTLFKYREGVGGVDFRLKKGIVGLQSEFNYQLALNKMRSDSASSIIATYVLGSVDAYKSSNFNLTPYAFYEFVRYYDTKNNPSLFSGVVPENSAGAVTPAMFNGYMKFMAGINMRFFTNFGIKAEYNFTRLLSSGYNFMDPTTVDKANDIITDKLTDIPGVTAQFYIQF